VQHGPRRFACGDDECICAVDALQGGRWLLDRVAEREPDSHRQFVDRGMNGPRLQRSRGK
jgi:hypothetical protein